MKRIALTGFGLFSTHSENPSQLLSERLGKEENVDSCTVPVSYGRCYSYAESLEGEVLLMIGLAAGRKDISLERCAYNMEKTSIPDTDGVMRTGEEIISGGEEKKETSIDLESLLEKLHEKGIPAHISDDPGRYVCNSIYYRALSDNRRPALFVHVPSLEDMDYATMEKAIRTIMEAL